MLLFEMVRAAQASLTSCAWFFDDFGGLEGRIAYAGRRGPSNCRRSSPPVSTGTFERSPRNPVDRRETGDAATLYLSLKTAKRAGRTLAWLHLRARH